jgi:uncharacterized protein
MDGARDKSLFPLALGATGLSAVSLLGVGGMLQLLHATWGLWASEVGCFLAIPFVALRAHGRAPLRTVGLGRPRLSSLALGAAVGLGNALLVVAPLQAAVRHLAPPEQLERFDQAGLLEGRRPVDLALLLVGVCLVAPLCEEFLFRGVLLRGLAERWGKAAAVAVSAALFAAIHFNPVVFLGLWEVGLLFGALSLATGSLWTAVAAHAANNGAAALAFLAAGSATAGPEGLSPEGLGTSMALGASTWALCALAVWRWPLSAPDPEDDAAVPVPWPEAARPWVLGLLLSCAWPLLDARAVQVALVDVDRRDGTPQERALHRRLRRQAEAGELSLEDFKARSPLLDSRPGS